MITRNNIVQPIHNWIYNRGERVKYYNFWKDQSPNEMWFSRFIKTHFVGRRMPRINFTSVLGPVEEMRDNRCGINIFYTGENLHSERFSTQKKLLEQQNYDLVLGFDHEGLGNNMRLPLWVLWCFPPEADRKTIDRIVNSMRYPVVGDRGDFCCLICSHDFNGVRGQIMDGLSSIGMVTSAGRYRNNTKLLQEVFHDDKVAFMRNYRFAICPENSNADGYVTEKLFDAILGGCIPIYSGSNNMPEPEVINRDAIKLWNAGGDNGSVIDEIRYLENNNQAYREFVGQARLKDEAEEIVWHYYVTLEERINQVL